MVYVVNAFIRQVFRIVIARPDAACVIRREADEPDVAVFCCRTGLAGDRHAAVELYVLTCSLSNYVLHRAREKRRRLSRNCPGRLRRIVDDNISVLIFYSCIKNRFGVIAFICNRRKCRRQLKVGNTVVDTAESQRLIDVVPLGQGSKAVLEQLIVRSLWCDIRDRLYRDRIYGIDDRIPDIHHVMRVGVVRVLYRGAVLVGDLVIEIGRRECLHSAVQCIGIGGQDLER